MELRVYKTGEIKKFDLRDTSVDEVFSFGEFTEVSISRNKDELTVFINGEPRFSGVHFSNFKNFDGTDVATTASECENKLNAILAANREVDKYIIGDSLAQKSETTSFVHNDSIDNGAAVILSTEDFKAGVEGNYIEMDATGTNGWMDFYVEVGGTETSHKALRIYGGSLTQGDARIDFLDTTIENLSITSLTEVPSSLGTAGQVLAVNSAGTALEFVAQSGGGGGGLGGSDQTLTANRTIDLNSNVLTIDDGSTDLMKISTANGVQIFGDLKIDSTNSIQGGSIKLEEGSLLGSNFIELRAPISITSDTTLILPDGDGTSGQVIQTNGSGTLSWSTKLSEINPVIKGAITIQRVASGNQPYLYIKGSNDLAGVFLKAPDAISSDVIYTLPGTDGTSGQALVTNGSGSLSFATVSGGGSTNELDGIYLDYFTRTSAYGAGSYEGQVVKFGTETNLTAGKCYVLRNDGGSPALAQWAEADANFVTATKGLFGIALGSSASSDGFLVKGIRGMTTGANPGDIMYISTTSGTVTNDISSYTTGDHVRVIGYALSSTLLYLDPSPDFIQLA